MKDIPWFKGYIPIDMIKAESWCEFLKGFNKAPIPLALIENNKGMKTSELSTEDNTDNTASYGWI